VYNSDQTLSKNTSVEVNTSVTGCGRTTSPSLDDRVGLYRTSEGGEEEFVSLIYEMGEGEGISTELLKRNMAEAICQVDEGYYPDTRIFKVTISGTKVFYAYRHDLDMLMKGLAPAPSDILWEFKTSRENPLVLAAGDAAIEPLINKMAALLYAPIEPITIDKFEVLQHSSFKYEVLFEGRGILEVYHRKEREYKVFMDNEQIHNFILTSDKATTKSILRALEGFLLSKVW
jgi:hypothetical protein